MSDGEPTTKTTMEDVTKLHKFVGLLNEGLTKQDLDNFNGLVESLGSVVSKFLEPNSPDTADLFKKAFTTAATNTYKIMSAATASDDEVAAAIDSAVSDTTTMKPSELYNAFTSSMEQNINIHTKGGQTTVKIEIKGCRSNLFTLFHVLQRLTNIKPSLKMSLVSNTDGSTEIGLEYTTQHLPLFDRLEELMSYLDFFV